MRIKSNFQLLFRMISLFTFSERLAVRAAVFPFRTAVGGFPFQDGSLSAERAFRADDGIAFGQCGLGSGSRCGCFFSPWSRLFFLFRFFGHHGDAAVGIVT